MSRHISARPKALARESNYDPVTSSSRNRVDPLAERPWPDLVTLLELERAPQTEGKKVSTDRERRLPRQHMVGQSPLPYQLEGWASLALSDSRWTTRSSGMELANLYGRSADQRREGRSGGLAERRNSIEDGCQEGRSAF
jgi:hypothetical protein